MISSTPTLARKLSVYSIRGVLASGSKHCYAINIVFRDIGQSGALTRGRSRLKGANFVSNESANMTAWKGSSRSSSAPFDLCVLVPFFDLGAMMPLI